jgi:hypothetical protein
MHTRGVGTQLGCKWQKTKNLKMKERKFISKQWNSSWCNHDAKFTFKLGTNKDLWAWNK